MTEESMASMAATSDSATDAGVDTDQGDVQASDVQETQTSSGVKEQSAEESFFDPNQVPDELKPAYKQMQAAFTKKTQEIANTKKEAEALRQKAEAYGRYEQYVPILEEMLKTPANAQQSNPEMAALEAELTKAGYSKEAIDLMKMGAGFVLNQVNQTQSQKEFQVRLETGVREAEKLDPRLTDTNLTYQTDDGRTLSFGDIVANIVKATPNWQQNPVQATRAAIKTVDALIGKAKTEGKQELSASAKAKAKQFPQINRSSQSAQSMEQAPSSMREAAQLARDELGI